jgi:hypothetical protein
MIRSALSLIALVVAAPLTAALAARGVEPAADALQDPSRVIAIDVLLEPSAEMARFAESANKGVRRSYPAGFTLGPRQAPHISLVHAYVRAGDLPQLEAKLAALLVDDNPLVIQLKATGYEHSVWEGLALMTIGIERSTSLSRVQAKVAAAVEPFSVAAGSADAFAVNPELPKIDESIVKYVANFIPNASGKSYRPHITIGLAPESIARDIEAIRFPHRTFRPAAAAIYQLGNFGTAQRKLWTWKPGSSKP